MDERYFKGDAKRMGINGAAKEFWWYIANLYYAKAASMAYLTKEYICIVNIIPKSRE